MTKAKRSKGEKTKLAGRTLLLETTDGEFKITLPAGSRVTFGPTIPWEGRRTGGVDRGYGAEPRGYSLRVYETSKNDSLIAVFGGIRSFRDISMPHAKLIIREAGQSLWKSDETGYKTETSVKTERAFDEFKLIEGKK